MTGPGRSHLELLFAEQVRTSHLPAASRNWRFHPTRKFELDFAWVPQKVALEIEGGIYSGGAHGRATGIVRDIEKGNLAILAGWRVFRATNHDIEDGSALALIKEALGG